ncbi:FG-GAP-like repeat-containing protein [Streptomyces camelliae]|uniref:FG-GAP-like repeat-containing protein n=1 Tax=Streptomyces camelliae TaxID=3004093 RepID=A0ABY7P7K8_9ACTN|nr:FG-GAP-like repeat-containing protein [Streptomyces sp. HUAS 2-6]WBO65545.1 FG-GAP-like repeat-containing protein [Streptomyces sp. HUAS 2-6]
MTQPRTRGKRTVSVAGVLTAGLTTGLLLAPPAQSVVGDQVADSADQYTLKVHINVGRDDERACSGTLVDAQWVLTAASCFATDPQQAGQVPAGAPAHTTVVTVDGNGPDATETVKQKVVELVPHPDRDLVMARIDNAATIDNPLDGPFPGITAAVVGSTAPAVRDQLRAVGYGRTKEEWVPGRAHTGSFGVDAVDASTLAISPGSGGGALCPGDAGGPVLDGRGRLVAVVARSWSGGCFGSTETRTGAVATRVDDIAGWIQQVRLKTRKEYVGDAVTAADFNGDGRTDIAAVLANGTAHVFTSRPDGTLEYGSYLNSLGRSGVKELVAGDFQAGTGLEAITVEDGGDLFLASKHSITPTLWTRAKLWNDAAWKDGLPVATLHSTTPGHDTPLFQWPDGSLYTYKRDGDGNLVNQKKSMSPDKTWKNKHIATGDFNGDGRDDIAAVASDGSLSLYLAKADGTFDKGRSMWPDKSWGSMRRVLGGDFNGDGKADLAVLTAGGDLRLYAGDGKGGLAAGRTMWPSV